MKAIVALFLVMGLEALANPCTQDINKFCQGVDPGKGQLSKCLSDYQNQLSPQCKEELQRFKKKTVQKNPCFEDLAEYCAELPEGPRLLEYCLLKNEAKLNDICSRDFKKKKSNFLAQDVCAQDIVNTCYASVSGPEGSINRCLIRNKAKLSGSCQKSIEGKIASIKKNNPCFDDIEKHCPTQVKSIDIQECLEKKISSLTPQCRPAVEAEIKKAQANPCYKDLVRHCRPGIDPGQQYECLGLNEEHLTRGCKDYRVKEQDKVKKMVDLCENDRLKFCSKAPFQNGMVVKCLREHKAQVSPACKNLL